MELSEMYAVSSEGQLVYVGATRNHTVWGLGKNGFLHGAGAYLRRHESGEEFIPIDEPSKEEIKAYYNLLNGFKRE